MAASKLAIGEDGKPRWLGTKAELLDEKARTEEALASIDAELNAKEALMGDMIEEALLAVPQSPALALAGLMMSRGLNPEDIDHYRAQSRRRGFLWPTT